MALLIYNDGLNMVVLDNELGRQMVDVCLAADKGDRMNNTIDKGYGFGDRAYEIIHHLESTTVVLLGPHIMVEQQAVGVPAHGDGGILQGLLRQRLGDIIAHYDACGNTQYGLQI